VINAWRWPAFRDAVDALNRTKLIIAAMTDSTCLQFPALDAVLEGFDVHGVIDASGAVSERTSGKHSDAKPSWGESA
jgi:nicotinamidase-related amidase